MRIIESIRRKLKKSAAFVLALVVGLPIFSSARITVSAAEYTERVNAYDKTYVIEDLGEEEVSKYEAKSGADPQLYSFMEYCYSDDETIRNARYGLYLYVYNPSRTEFSETLGANKASMAVSYDSQGAPTDYANLKLKNCGHTTGKYDKLFYKFRIMGLSQVVENATAMNAAHSARRYDLVEIQLKDSDTGETESYGIATIFNFSGYSVGCDASSSTESTLVCKTREMETIRLDVYSTYDRMGDYSQDQLDVNTAYFGVDESYFENYGGLQKIEAEWYEYKTNPIFVTSDEEAYAALKEYVGVDIGRRKEDLDWRVMWEIVQETTAWYDWYTFGKSYNLRRTSESTIGAWEAVWEEDYLSRMDWLIFRENAAGADDFDISRAEVKKYMETYTNDHPTQERIRDKYASYLFADSIDENRLQYLEDQTSTRGYVNMEIDAGATWETDLFDKDDMAGWLAYILGESETYPTEKYAFDPIIVLDDQIENMSVEGFAQEYLINDEDATEVLANCKAMLKEGKRPVLFRFAITEFSSDTAKFDKDDGGGISQDDGYVAQQTLFFDFNVIDLTFCKDGVLTVIPVVSKPIDVIKGVDAPDELDEKGSTTSGSKSGCADKAKTVFIVLAVVLAVIVLIRIIVWLVERHKKSEYARLKTQERSRKRSRNRKRRGKRRKKQ